MADRRRVLQAKRPRGKRKAPASWPLLVAACVLVGACVLVAGCDRWRHGDGADPAAASGPDAKAAGLDAAASDAADAGPHPDDTAIGAPSDVSAADAVGPVADATPVADAGTICPGPDKPGPDTFVGDVPKPDAAPCDLGAPTFFKGVPPPAKAWSLEIGRIDATGAFVPFVDGDWIAFETGTQGGGGFHVWVAVRFKLPGVTDPIAKVQVSTQVVSGCTHAGFSPYPVVYAKPDADGSYVVGLDNGHGIQVFMGSGEEGANPAVLSQYCNKWYDLRVSGRQMLKGGAFGPWGESTVRVRSYDLKNIPVSP